MISTDEKTGIQARKRICTTTPCAPNQKRRVESEYERKDSLAYMAAWDVHHAKIFGICEKQTGIEPYRRLENLVMQQTPYRTAKRVFWVTDNGSSHRGTASCFRLSRVVSQCNPRSYSHTCRLVRSS